MKKQSIVLAACMIGLLLLMNSCGGEQGENYFYSVNVINNTGSTITVRYDWDILFISRDWLGITTIPAGNNEIIEWISGISVGEQIEVEYLGKKKLYTVTQLGTTLVNAGFPELNLAKRAIIHIYRLDTRAGAKSNEFTPKSPIKYSG